jgi:hypothetical protein
MDAKYGGLKLVWSRDSKQEPAAAIERSAREPRPKSARVLAAKAAAGPLIRAGHALLRWMKIPKARQLS